MSGFINFGIDEKNFIPLRSFLTFYIHKTRHSGELNSKFRLFKSTPFSFTAIVKNMNFLDNIGTPTVTPAVDVQETGRTGKSGQKIQKWPEKCQKIINAINENKYVTIGDLEKLLDTGHTTIKKMLAEMQKEKYIRRVGADKGGYWEVLELGEKKDI